MSHHEYPERLSNRGYGDDCTNQTTMEVLVETLTGTAYEITVSPSDTVFAIKSKIFRVEGIPISQQHLLYNLKELDDASSLREHSISDGARLRLVLGMRGGPVSTRRLPIPVNIDTWKDIKRHLDNNRENGEGLGVTMLMYGDGKCIKMVEFGEEEKLYLRRSEHVPQPSQLTENKPDERDGTSHDNLVTMSKMAELRQKMDRLTVRRPTPKPDKVEIQKTRSEEILSVPSLLDEPNVEPFTRSYAYCEAEDTFAPLYDGNYTRYDYGCSFADRYTLLPPIGARTDSNPSVQDTETESIKLSDALAGSILVQGSRHDSAEDAAILEECLDSSVDECPLRQESAQLATKNLAPIQTAEYGPLVGVESGWRVRGFGSSSQLTPAPRSAIHLHQPLSNTVFSSSTSDLEKLKRNRILPALIRHRNREHLHLSDEGLDRSLEVGSERRQRRINKIAEDCRLQEVEAERVAKEKKVKIRCGFCKKRLSIATVHKCRCGVEYCAPHRYAEVHGCAYDYKANAQEYLQRANPLISVPKLPKI